MSEENTATKKDYSWFADMKAGMSKAMVATVADIRKTEFTPELGDKPVPTIHFERSERPRYIAEVAKKGEDYLFHFYPRGAFPPKFEVALHDAFLEVFRFKERLSANHDEFYRCSSGDDCQGCGFRGRPDEVASDRGRPYCPDCSSYAIVPMLNAWSIRAEGFAGNPMADELAKNLFEVLDRHLNN